MANETTTTSLTELVNSAAIEELVLDYAHSTAVASPFQRVADLTGRASLAANFPVWVKDAAGSKTEGTAMSNTLLETTDTTVTAAEYGILREPTDLVLNTNVLGAGGLMNALARDAAILLMEQLETLITAEYANPSVTVGSTGVDLTVANFVSGIGSMATNQAKGPKVSVMHPQQVSDLLSNLVSVSTSIWSSDTVDKSILNGQNGSDGYIGSLLGIPIYSSGTCPTVAMGADRAGAIQIDGASAPRNAPIGVAALWMVRMKALPSAANTSEQMAWTSVIGAGEISDFNYVGIHTDA